MGEELEPIKESLEALVGESGILGPVEEYGEYIRSRVQLRNLPRLVERATAAAEKIRASGLPRKAWAELDEPLVTAILEGMAEETDPDLQQAWENLLANVATDGSSQVHRGFPHVLKRLEPREAGILDRWTRRTVDTKLGVTVFGKVQKPGDSLALGNLISLNLIERTKPTPNLEVPNDHPLGEIGFLVTRFGWLFAAACRAPEHHS